MTLRLKHPMIKQHPKNLPLDAGAEILGDDFHKHMTTANYKGKLVFGKMIMKYLLGRV